MDSILDTQASVKVITFVNGAGDCAIYRWRTAAEIRAEKEEICLVVVTESLDEAKLGSGEDKTSCTTVRFPEGEGHGNRKDGASI